MTEQEEEEEDENKRIRPRERALGQKLNDHQFPNDCENHCVQYNTE